MSSQNSITAAEESGNIWTATIHYRNKKTNRQIVAHRLILTETHAEAEAVVARKMDDAGYAGKWGGTLIRNNNAKLGIDKIWEN